MRVNNTDCGGSTVNTTVRLSVPFPLPVERSDGGAVWAFDSVLSRSTLCDSVALGGEISATPRDHGPAVGGTFQGNNIYFGRNVPLLLLNQTD